MKIIFIAALDLNSAIGYENKLLWSIPADLQYFKAKTVGKTVLMGRKTFDSIGRPLPSRQNWVLSKSAFSPSGVTVFNSVEAVLASDITELWVIGGAEIYSLFLPYCTEMYLTRVRTKIEHADSHFPNFSGFTLVETVENRGTFDYDFERWAKTSLLLDKA